MSKIRTALKARIEKEIQEKNKPFICIHELVEIIMNSDSSSFNEAAKFLGLIIKENAPTIETLCYFWTEETGYKVFTSFQKHYMSNYKSAQNGHFLLLEEFLVKNKFDGRSIGFLNDYGVDRKEFSKLLAAKDILIDLGACIETLVCAENETKPIETVSIVDISPQHKPIKTVTAASASKGTNWRHVVQQEAWHYWLTLKASGANPNPWSISDRMSKWCHENNINGGKGSPVKGKTLYNTVLGGRHWTQPSHTPEQARKALEKLPELPESKLPDA